MEASTAGLMEAYTVLLDRFGDPHWWPGDTPFEVCVGAILTQNTAWTNVERSVRALRSSGMLDPFRIIDATHSELAKAVESSGYHNQKASYLKAFCSFLADRFDGSVEAMGRTDHRSLREMLLEVRGIGEETADSILCYASGAPVLVVDAYTRRLVRRLCPAGWRSMFGEAEPAYKVLQHMLMERLMGDNALYNRFHALVVVECKEYCRKVQSCGGCPLNVLCDTGRKRI
jgi:endonuclease-3 related protein